MLAAVHGVEAAPARRADMSKPQQLVVTFAGGYIAGVFCAVVSHPADTVVSKLNADVGSTPVKAAKELGWKGIPFLTLNPTLVLILNFFLDGLRIVERSWGQDCHDWNPDSSSVVHLRLGQSVLPFATPTTS